MSKFALCPFYLGDKRNSITCEDTVRQFYSKTDKRKWCSAYCDTDWESCPYAQDLNDLYERMDAMTTQKERDIAALEHQVAVKTKENTELRQRIGYLDKKVQSLEMMLGYLVDKTGMEQIPLADMAKFYASWKVNWKQTDSEYIIFEKVKK